MILRPPSCSHRSCCWIVALGLLLLARPCAVAEQRQNRPNIVLIMSDDQGWGDLSVHGHVNLRTPNIDSLARDGGLFERFFVCPVCSPTLAWRALRSS